MISLYQDLKEQNHVSREISVQFTRISRGSPFISFELCVMALGKRSQLADGTDESLVSHPIFLIIKNLLRMQLEK